MPYIKPELRERMEPDLKGLMEFMWHPGNLNYAITRLVLEYVRRSGLSYTTIATVTGVLENTKQEFYRRYAGLYEDMKIAENGDVYP